MNSNTIRAGTMGELLEHSGDWLFVDIGFARSKKSCGYLLVEESADGGQESVIAEATTFGDLTRRAVALVEQAGPPLHLVIEAPLSAAFAGDGSPVGRTCEKKDGKTRYWYVGLGCSVLVAGLYLLRAISKAARKREVRVFEGLVSFKERTKSSNHIADVEALKAVVWSGGTVGGRFCDAASLNGDTSGVLESTLALLGLDSTPPPIIEAIPG